MYIGSLPLMNGNFLPARLINILFFIINNWMVIWLTARYIRNKKIALLAGFYFSILPWTLEQSRIVSEPNSGLFIVLSLIFLLIKFRKIKFIYLLIPVGIFLFTKAYPHFFMLKSSWIQISLKKYISNLFFLSSPEFLFFRNTTFWWGGLTDFGVMMISLIPLFLLGIYISLLKNYKLILISSVGIWLISGLSIALPESREFFFITPLLCFYLSVGTYVFARKNNFYRVLFIFLCLSIFYETAQVWHEYTKHYPLKVSGNLEKIYEPF